MKKLDRFMINAEEITYAVAKTFVTLCLICGLILSFWFLLVVFGVADSLFLFDFLLSGHGSLIILKVLFGVFLLWILLGFLWVVSAIYVGNLKEKGLEKRISEAYSDKKYPKLVREIIKKYNIDPDEIDQLMKDLEEPDQNEN